MSDAKFDVQLELWGGMAEDVLRAQEDRQLATQLAVGQCDYKPMPKRLSEPFRSELAVEQSSLFISNRTKRDWFEREWPAKIPGTGEAITRRLVVGKFHEHDRPRGVLTQAHQDAFYVLLDMWGKQGYNVVSKENQPCGFLASSLYQIVKAIRGNDGATHYERVKGLLGDLASIPVVLETRYPKRGTLDRDMFRLLDSVSWSERNVNIRTGNTSKESDASVEIMLSPHVTSGFLRKRVKIILGGTYRSLGSDGSGARSEIARMLYPFLDGQLATKDEYHVKLAELLAWFDLTVYEYKSKRREVILPAVKMLDGAPILQEKFRLRVALRESSDGRDYVLVAAREAREQIPLWADSKSGATVSGATIKPKDT